MVSIHHNFARKQVLVTEKSVRNPKCTVHAEIHPDCADRYDPGPAAGLQMSPLRIRVSTSPVWWIDTTGRERGNPFPIYWHSPVVDDDCISDGALVVQPANKIWSFPILDWVMSAWSIACTVSPNHLRLEKWQKRQWETSHVHVHRCVHACLWVWVHACVCPGVHVFLCFDGMSLFPSLL